MGRDCGYLALMSGLASGRRAGLSARGGHHAGRTCRPTWRLARQGFRAGKRLGLVIRNECADPLYTTGFMRALFEKEGGDLFDVQQAVLGQLAQGGSPSPFDRALATRLAAQGIARLIAEAEAGRQVCLCAGSSGGDVIFQTWRARRGDRGRPLASRTTNGGAACAPSWRLWPSPARRRRRRRHDREPSQRHSRPAAERLVDRRISQ